MRYIIIFASMFLMACDSVVYEESEKIGREIGNNTCSTGPGYCMECGLNLTGGYDCFAKMKMSCSGTQKAIFDVFIVTKHYESGDIKKVKRKRFLEALEECH